MSINQAVIFTKPTHHLRVDLSPENLDRRLRCFFEPKGFRFVVSKKVTGAELQARDVIRQHYLMYSTASCAETVCVSEEAKERFNAFFGATWRDELAGGRIISTPELLKRPDVDVQQLFYDWKELCCRKKTVKLQAGFVMGFDENLGVYIIDAFYPLLEAIFYHQKTVLHYHVVEFDAEQTSWSAFRQNILGTTNASIAAPESFRGELYHETPVECPNRDNYVHGSAGPLEGLVERTIHEVDFELTTNPVGAYLAARGDSLQSFSTWRTSQTLETIGRIFDETEEKNTDEIFQTLEQI